MSPATAVAVVILIALDSDPETSVMPTGESVAVTNTRPVTSSVTWGIPLRDNGEVAAEDPARPTSTTCGRDGVDVIRCVIIDNDSSDEDAADDITDADVLRAVEEVGLPKGSVLIQPGNGSTIVNVPTVFSTQPTRLETTVELLGTPVTVIATPTSYRWHHGDGTSQATTSPGRAWPNADVTHAYQHTAESVTVSVDITYSIDYRVGDGPLRHLDDTVTTLGPGTNIHVLEATPVLTNGE